LFSAYARVRPMKGRWSSIPALCLAFCLLMPMGAVGVVLCIGVDGHIAFEPARHSRCTTPIVSTSTPSQQSTQLASQSDHCGPCVDVPVLTSEGNQQLVAPSPLLLTYNGPMLALAMPLVAMPVVHAAPLSAWSSFPAVSPMLMALRTVVLLL